MPHTHVYASLLSGIIVSTLAVEAGWSQETYSFVDDQTEIKLSGSTNIQSWDAETKIGETDIILQEFTDTSLDFERFYFTIPVEAIDSGNSRETSSIHEYLRKEDHPEISYELSEIKSFEENNSQYVVEAAGDLSVAGVTQNIVLSATMQKTSDSTFRIIGEYEMKMTDFDIDPPTAFLGAVRARDELKVNYEVTLTR